jgi:ABC-type Fe3+-hydroxamate transport system substrate-binding protein
MSDDDTDTTEAPTRRDYMKYGGAVVGGGLLAGCAGQSDSAGTPEPTNTDSETATPEATATDDTEDGRYTVELSPVGEVEFDGVPETVASQQHLWADTITSFGYGDRVVTTRPGYVTSHHDQLPGVEVDTEGLTETVFQGKEDYYEADPDVFHVDPFPLKKWSEWEESDVEEITDNVAPFFANQGSRNWSESYYPVDEGYEFYTLEELTRKFGQVYESEAQAEELIAVRQELVSEIQSNLPPESERPSVGHILWYDGEIYPYLTNVPGYGKTHLTPLGVEDAFADLDTVYSGGGGTVDLEGLLEIDPDVLLMFIGYSSWFEMYDKAAEQLESDPVGQELTAIQNDDFYRGGAYDQGILLNLFQLEMSAKQFYPEQFGEWPGVEEEAVLPEIPEDERLFDRQRVADIVNGDI